MYVNAQLETLVILKKTHAKSPTHSAKSPHLARFLSTPNNCPFIWPLKLF